VIRNVSGGYDDAMESLNLRGKLKWTPSALPGVEAVASYNRVRREGAISINMPAPTCPIITTTGRPPPINPIAVGLPATLPCSLGVPLADGLRPSSATSWNRSRAAVGGGPDNTAANLSTINNIYRFKTLTQELRLNYEGNRLSALLGRGIIVAPAG
jgi:hypothetical protein